MLKLVLVVLLLIMIWELNSAGLLEKEKVRAWIAGFGNWAPIVYIAVYSVAPAFFLPGLPLTVAAGLLFGPWYGTLYAITGATSGATVAFLTARYLFRDRSFFSERMKAIDEGLARYSIYFLAFTRLIPLFPFNFLNYAFGLTNIKLRHYIIVSFVCMLPATAAYVIFSSTLFDLLTGKIAPEFIIGAILVIILAVLPAIYKYKQK